MRGCEGGEQVEDVHFAGETRNDFRGARGRFKIDHRAAGSERVACRAPVALADAVSAHFRAGLARGAGQFFRAGIVGVDDGNPRRGIDGAIEEQTLGREILLHRAVIVEVIAGEVGKHGHIEIDACGAALVEAVAGNFRDQFGCSVRDAFGHKFKEIARLGRGVDRGPNLACDVIFDRADQHGLAGGGVQKRFGEKGRCRFAVGAGDAGGGERALGMAEEGGRCFGQRAAAVFDFKHGMPAR